MLLQEPINALSIFTFVNSSTECTLSTSSGTQTLGSILPHSISYSSWYFAELPGWISIFARLLSFLILGCSSKNFVVISSVGNTEILAPHSIDALHIQALESILNCLLT